MNLIKTPGYLVFWNSVPGAGYLDNSFKVLTFYLTLHMQTKLKAAGCLKAWKFKTNRMADDLISKALNPDEVLVRIGQMGRFQVRLILIISYIKMTLHGFQLLLATFLAAEPPWRCVSNSSSCNITGSLFTRTRRV